MKTGWVGLAVLASIGVVGLVPAHADVYVSGVLHQPVGSAVLGTPEGRRLPVHNLGSSGEDGVEVQLHSVYGGAVGVDLTNFSGGSSSREIRIRPKGWDGTIKGTLRAYNSSSTGQTMLTADFSDIGALESSYNMYDDAGHLVASGILPAEGLAMGGPCLGQYQIWYIQATLISWGPPKQWAFTWHYYCSPCPDPWLWFPQFGCGGISTQLTVVITPNLPPGLPGIDNLESMLITGNDLPDVDGDGQPELVVGNAALESFPIPCPPWDCLGPTSAFYSTRWGLGQAQISEECTPDSMGTCDESVRRLSVSNLGSSGQDGVAIGLPPNNNGVSVQLAKGNCCRGHVIIMKLYDDEGQEQRIIRTQTTDPSGTEELDADFSSLGATGYRLWLYDGTGGVLGPAGGTAIFNGGPKPTMTNACPPGSNEIWENIGTTSNPVWHFVGCTPTGSSFDFTIPGVGTIPNVASFRVEPLDATSNAGRLVECDLLSDDDEGFVVEGITVRPAVLGDMNCDGVVNNQDIDGFVMALFNAAGYAVQYHDCNIRNGDFTGDSVVNNQDIDGFVSALFGG